MTCRENKYINVEFIWNMCKYTNNDVAWHLDKGQAIDWMVTCLIIRSTEMVSTWMKIKFKILRNFFYDPDLIPIGF